jgi:two-component system, sensor histidine kinase and response regulator
MTADRAPGGASILVVDDTVENLQLLASMLSAHGYEVRPVTNGRDALTAARSDPPELILLDVTMPEMDGYEVCARLKESAELREIPVIFLTALSSTADKVKAFEAGGADYVTKPFQLDEVLARIRVHVALRRSRLELLASYERLRGLEKLREDLVQMVVHDMRSPLSGLIQLLNLIQTDPACTLGEGAMTDLQIAVQAATGLNGLANDLLDVSRLEEDKLPLDRRPNDVVAICRDVLARVAPFDRTRRLDLEAAGVMPAHCDRRVVERVLENLVGNAMKHTPSRGRVWVSAVAGPGRVRVAVHDEGPGVPVEARSKIFEKFGTIAARHEGHYHSAGLGLTFCKLAVEAHGGSIGVDGGASVGSVFWFELPA